MDTLPTSVSSLKVSGLNSTTPKEVHHFKPPPISNLAASPSHHLLTTKPNSISNKPSSSSLSYNNRASPFVSSSSPRSPSQVTHQNATSGYAAALLDVARCNNVLEAMERDVQRFSRLLRRDGDLRSVMIDPFLDDKVKGEVVKEIAEKGKFQKYLVALIKMMVKKNKVGLVGEVLQEFERIYDELSGTQLVLVSSAKKMEEDQLISIARSVQKLSGSMKVKVRNFIAQSLP